MGISGKAWRGGGMPDCLGFRKKEVLTHQTLKKKKKSQWFKQFEVDRLKKVLLLSKEIFPTGSSKTLHWLIPQIFLKS